MVDGKEDNYFECHVCELRFLNPDLRLKAAEEKSRYELHNNDVDDPGYKNFVEPVYQIVKANLPIAARGLDFGAGAGPVLARRLEEGGFKVSLFDPYFWPDRKVLEFKYDFIVSCEVIEHLYNPSQEFQMLKSMLEPNGLLVLKTHFYSRDKNFETWYYRKDPTHVCFYTLNSMRWIANNLGFQSLQTHGDRIAVMNAD